MKKWFYFTSEVASTGDKNSSVHFLSDEEMLRKLTGPTLFVTSRLWSLYELTQSGEQKNVTQEFIVKLAQ